jgi:hypothetical protein
MPGEDLTKINETLDRIKAPAGGRPPEEDPDKVELPEYLAMAAFLIIVALALWATIPH